MAVQLGRRAVDVIESRLWHQLALGVHPACALAVYSEGAEMLALEGGVARVEFGDRVSPDTLYSIWSCGKPLAASCLWLLKDRGMVNWSDMVADHWPEFAANGKEAVTVEHVLTHQAGLPNVPAPLTHEDFLDLERVAAAHAAAPPEFEPGSAIQYHSATFGWLVAELVRRISGRPFADFFKSEVAEPLGLDHTYFGLPQGLDDHVAELKAMPGFERAELAANGNSRMQRTLVAPGFAGISTARDLAKFYSVLVAGGSINGRQWLSAEVIEDVISVHAEGEERGTGQHRKWGLGVQLGSIKFGEQAGPRTFGHGGVGTSITWGDPDLNIGVAVITTGMQPDNINDDRLKTMSDLIRAAVTT